MVVSRAMGRVEYPADFMLIAAVNPCPCGFLGHPRKACNCSQFQIEKYKRRISGPILDRIDLHVNVAAVESDKLEGQSETSHSKEIRQQVIKARAIQSARFKNTPGRFTNSQMKNKEVKEFCKLDSEGTRLMKMAVEKYDLSARGYFRLLKVARTIADLEGEENLSPAHIAEALRYRVRVF